MKITEPKLDNRAEQPYMGIRRQDPTSAFKDTIPQLLNEVFGWLGQRGIAPAGPPFMRYYIINMPGEMDYEIGVPVASAVTGDDRVRAGMIPAGRYASLVYTGIENGIPGNKALIDWAQANGIQWDRWDDPKGDAFRSRIEFFLTSPDDEPNPSNWRTEVAILTA